MLQPCVRQVNVATLFRIEANSDNALLAQQTIIPATPPPPPHPNPTTTTTTTTLVNYQSNVSPNDRPYWITLPQTCLTAFDGQIVDLEIAVEIEIRNALNVYNPNIYSIWYINCGSIFYQILMSKYPQNIFRCTVFLKRKLIDKFV